MSLYVELAVALVVTAVFTLMAVLNIRERHRDVEAWHVTLGAAIYGAVFGAVVGFVIVPLRALLIDGSLPPQTAAGAGFGFLAIMIALRSGIISRLPFLGPQVKAYRRAVLRRSIEKAQEQLAKLTPSNGAAHA